MKKQAEGAPIFDMLDRLKDYTQFETVTVSPDGTVSVKYAPKVPKGKRDAEARQPTAIDSLKMQSPPFGFGS